MTMSSSSKLSQLLTRMRISLGFFFALLLLPSPGFSQIISCGQTITDSISAVGEKDTHNLQGLSQGDTITLRMVKTSGSLSPYLELYDGAGTKIAYGSGSLTKQLTTAGPYTVLARDNYNSYTGNYRLSLQRVNNPCQATTLACGQSLAGGIALVGEMDTYLLQGLSQGDTITLQMVMTSGRLSPYLELYDGAGTKIAYGSGGGLTKKLDTAGPYTVLAWDYYNSGTGGYRLSLQRVNNPCQATTLACGQSLAGGIALVGEMDTYLLQGLSQGDTITLQMVMTSGRLSPYLELYDGAGTKIAYGSGSLTKQLTTAGPYTVLARDSGNSQTGDYSLFLQRVNNPCQATTLAIGQILSGTISPVTEIDTYVLQGVSQGATITLCAGSGDINPALELYDGAGTRIATGSWSITNKQLTTAGPYMVLVQDSGANDTGGYRLSLQGGNFSCSSLDLQDPKVTVMTPSSGEIIETGSTFVITWTSTDNIGVTSHEIRLSTDGGVSFPTVVATGLAGSLRSFNWSVPPGLATTKGRIRVIARDAAGNTGYDDSNNFLVINTAQLKITSYTYDQLNRLTRVEYEDGKVILYAYDSVGNRTSLVVTAVSQALRLYIQGMDNGLWVNSRSGSTWSGWSAVPGGGKSSSGPAGVLDGSSVRLVVRGLDNGIWTALADNPQWTSLGGRTFHSPAAVMEGSTLHVFVRGTDGGLYLNSRSGGSFSGWSAVPGGGKSSSQPAAVLDSSGTLRLYIQGMDNGLWVNSRSGSTWSGWSAVPGGGKSSSGPAGVLDGSSVRLVIRGLDNEIWTALADNPQWTSLGGKTNHSPAAVMEGSTLHVFVRGTDGGLYLNSRSGGSFSGWSAVPGGGKSSSQPAVVPP